MAVRLRVLGPVEAELDGSHLDLGHARQRCVLAALLVDVNRPVPPARLIDRVWADDPPVDARGALYGYLSRLRRVLAPGGVAIHRQPAGYLLRCDPSSIDLHQFAALVDRARTAATTAAALTALEEALRLWRGEPFADLDTPWITQTRAEWERRRFAAELDRNDHELADGGHSRLLPALLASVNAHPLDERLVGQLMIALYRSGRQADALAEFHRLRARLDEEMGTGPAPPLRELYQNILVAEPVLIRARPAASVGTAVPRQLPAAPSRFTGRHSELAALDRAMASDDPPGAVVVSAVGGVGGIGKTWLALEWAHRNQRRYPDGVLYIDLRGFDPSGEPVATEAALRSFLYALEPAARPAPVGVQALAARYRSLVDGRRMLVFIDNARDAASVVPLLPGTASCAVLVTSRRQLTQLVLAHGARPLTLDMLDRTVARDLLRRHLGDARLASEPAAVDVLLTHCAGLPLALGIVAARALVQPRTPLAALAAELQDTASRLDGLDLGELAGSLRAVLSCSVPALTPAALRALQLLALQPGSDLGFAAATSLLGTTPGDCRRLLGELLETHLINEPVPGRYRMHDLVRLYAAEIGGRGAAAADVEPAMARLLDHQLHTAHRAALLLSPFRTPLALPPPCRGTTPEHLDDLQQAMRWFTDEHRALLGATRHAAAHGYDLHACYLPWTLATFYGRRGHWTDWLAAQSIAVEAADRLNDLRARAESRRLLANAYSNLRRYGEARTNFQDALDLFTELRDDAARAHSHLDLALLADRHGRPTEALPHARQSLALYRTTGTPLQLAVALNAVGWYHTQLGEHGAAIAYCREALALSEQIDDPYGQSNTLDSLGYAHHQLGEYELAIDCYDRAIRLFRQIGDRDSEGIVLDHLGDAWAAAGDSQRAAVAWRSAATLLDRLGNPGAAGVQTKLDRICAPAAGGAEGTPKIHRRPARHRTG